MWQTHCPEVFYNFSVHKLNETVTSLTTFIYKSIQNVSSATKENERQSIEMLSVVINLLPFYFLLFALGFCLHWLNVDIEIFFTNIIPVAIQCTSYSCWLLGKVNLACTIYLHVCLSLLFLCSSLLFNFKCTFQYKSCTSV